MSDDSAVEAARLIERVRDQEAIRKVAQAKGLSGSMLGAELELAKLAPLLSSALLSSHSQAERMREALEWYGENARLCRLIHKEGDAGRHALADDGGKRARAALSPKEE